MALNRREILNPPKAWIPTEPVSPLDVLVCGLFDYAGMFPPASLPYQEALERAARFPQLLARPHLVAADLVLPYERLEQTSCEQLARSGFGADRRVKACVLGASLSDPETVVSQARALAIRNQRTQAEAPAQRVVSFEIKLPAQVDRGLAADSMARLLEILAPAGITVFVEPEWTTWQGLDGLVDLLLEHGRDGAACGLKVRGSGLTAIPLAALAQVIEAVAARSLPFKATAGLHHPIPEDRHGNSLGFVNLAAALRLRQVLGPQKFPIARIEDCLSTRDPGSFDFSRGLSWTELALDRDELAGAMAQVSFTIGSCSLEEPDSGLIRLFSSGGPR